MELSRIPDIGPVYASILAEAGVATVADLAAVTDLEALAARTKVHPATLDAFRAAAAAHVQSLLEGAGVHGPEELARADVDALAASTGLARSSLVTYRRAARAKLGLPEEDPVAKPLPADRVILADGRATARVSLNGEIRAGVAIVTLFEGEDEAGALESAKGDAVLLRERAVTAPVRVDGVLHRDLPIFKEQAAEAEAPREIRVRVTEIKDRARPAPAPMPAGQPAESAEAAEEPRKKGFSLFRRGKKA